MKDYIQIDPWKIIEEGFDPENNRVSESIFSLGNGRFGIRGNFEENYSGDSLQGSYVAGIYYPDPTRVGWWKNGYPDYYAKVLNATNWIGIEVKVDQEYLDLAHCEILSFKRELNMQNGVLSRKMHVKLPSGNELKIQSQRFCSIANDNLAAIRYSVESVNFDGIIVLNPYLDGDVINEDSNFDQKFWLEEEKEVFKNGGYLTIRTKKLDFHLTCGMENRFIKNGEEINVEKENITKEKYVSIHAPIEVKAGDVLTIEKYIGLLSSENHEKGVLFPKCHDITKGAIEKGFDQLLAEHEFKWKKKWENADIRIEGDKSAQQGIRFNIFQLNQTYTGEDHRLNIGPKGFTGEKYGGCTYWDTEAFCFDFYMSTAPQSVARNLLIYRHNHLKKAIENAQKLGFKDGAALYPMVTINGEECHNEWEITFEEIHRNGAIAYAIHNYVNYTGDKLYLAKYGLEVLIAIARFWAQRVNWSDNKEKYVILGVTGPNEYENNVNNNWYTNYIASWCLQYTIDCIDWCLSTNEENWKAIESTVSFKSEEASKWLDIIEKMYYPFDEERQVFLQQDGFLDKEIRPASSLPESEVPIWQHWSWDRILRSCFIKQADVLQGMYFFRNNFSKEELERNFDFYEPITVHESSLSACVHSILAADLGKKEKAYEMYLRTSRLDLDDYNNDAADGLHITSMGGTWMSVVEGFGGMRILNRILTFEPSIPDEWKSLSFNVIYRENPLEIRVDKDSLEIQNLGSEPVKFKVYDQELVVQPGEKMAHETSIVS